MPETVTVSGTILKPDNATPAVGSVSLIPPGFITDAVDGTVYQGPAKAVLDLTGAFSLDVVATDATGINPTSFTYKLQIKLHSGMQTKIVSLPKANAAVNLADLIDVPQSNGQAAFAVRSVEANGTVYQPDTAGNVDLGTLAGSGTVDDATTTTKGIVQLAGDLGGTAAAPTVPGLAGKAAASALTTEAATARAAETAAQNAAAAAQATADAALPKAGGAMTGAVVLADDAAANLHPTTLQQVNGLISAAVALLVGGADAAHDTLVELQNLLNTDESTAAALATTVAGKLAKSANLSDLTNAVTARTNLGLGSAALSASTDFQPTDADLTAIAALTTTTFGRALLTQADAAALRATAGLGTAALAATGDFDAAGAAAAAQAASQPLDSDLTAIAALTTTAFGRAFLELANAAAGRTALGLGTAALSATGDFVGPVDTAGRSDLRVVYWDAASTTHKYGDQLSAPPSGHGQITGGDTAIPGAIGTTGTQTDVTGATLTVPVVASGDVFLDVQGFIDQTAGRQDVTPVRAATTAALAANTYANGTAGVGATLTANANGALAAVDGVTLVAGDRLLVKDEASGLKNGIYTVTQVGTAGAPYILTRATDADTAAELLGVTVFVRGGANNANADLWWTLTTTGITVGTTALTFAQFVPTAEVAKAWLWVVETTGGINASQPYSTNIAAIAPVQLAGATTGSGSTPRNRTAFNIRVYLSNGNASTRTFKLVATTHSPSGQTVTANFKAAASAPLYFDYFVRY